MQSFYDGMTIVGSMVVMVAVIVLTYYGSRWYARKMGGTVSSKYLKILDKVSLGSGCAVVVVQVGEKFYLVGTSDKNIRMLCELTDFDASAPDGAVQTASFNQMIQGFLKKAGNLPKDDGTEK